MDKKLQILELFGGIGSPRIALRNLGVPVKSIDYVEIDEKAVRSYNAMFADDMDYNTQDVRGWNLKPDILIHGSPCQDVSIAGHRKGNDKGSGTRSSLMWETITIIRNMGVWKPRVVIWENVKGVLSKTMRKNFDRYLSEMEGMGYVNSYECLNAMDFGLPQNRERVFTVSILNGPAFDFGKLERKPMKREKKMNDKDKKALEAYNYLIRFCNSHLVHLNPIHSRLECERCILRLRNTESGCPLNQGLQMPFLWPSLEESEWS